MSPHHPLLLPFSSTISSSFPPCPSSTTSSCPYVSYQALGLDPSLSVEDLVKQAHSIKENLEETKKAADWCHLLVAENLKDCTIQVT